MIDRKYSVKNVLLVLSRINMYMMKKGEIVSEVPKKAKAHLSVLKVDLDILLNKTEIRFKRFLFIL